MPSKDIHQAATLLLAGTAYHLAASHTGTPEEQLLAVSGILTGVVITPDMDLAENFSGEPFWYLYGRLFKHRGVSHWPVVGTLTRIAYTAVFLVPFIWLFGYGWWLVLQIRTGFFFVWLAGLSAADTLHYLLDITVTKVKRAL
jgi:uncharacterized metal-binding protein